MPYIQFIYNSSMVDIYVECCVNYSISMSISYCQHDLVGDEVIRYHMNKFYINIIAYPLERCTCLTLQYNSFPCEWQNKTITPPNYKYMCRPTKYT